MLKHRQTDSGNRQQLGGTCVLPRAYLSSNTSCRSHWAVLWSKARVRTATSCLLAVNASFTARSRTERKSCSAAFEWRCNSVLICSASMSLQLPGALLVSIFFGNRRKIREKAGDVIRCQLWCESQIKHVDAARCKGPAQRVGACKVHLEAELRSAADLSFSEPTSTTLIDRIVGVRL
jgi:hypothetical protein